MVILNFNGKDHLSTYLPSVIRNNPKDAEIIVADNGSSDDSLLFMKTNYPDIRIIEISKNRGFAGGYNAALEELDHEYFVLLNSDVEVTLNWLDPIIVRMDSDLSIAAMQPKILSWRSKSQFEHAGACGGFLDSLSYSFCRGRIMDVIEDDNGQYDDAIRICWATGAAMVIRGRLFHAMEGFDERYFAHFEEIDLCWRLRRAGYIIGVEPSSVVYHLGGGTLAYNTPFKIRLNFRNSLFTIWKNEPFLRLLYKFPLRLILDGIAALQFLLQGKISFFKAVFAAHLEFYRALPSSIRTREQERKLVEAANVGVKEDRSTVYKGLIILDFFIRKKRRFHEIMKGNEI